MGLHVCVAEFLVVEKGGVGVDVGVDTLVYGESLGVNLYQQGAGVNGTYLYNTFPSYYYSNSKEANLKMSSD